MKCNLPIGVALLLLTACTSTSIVDNGSGRSSESSSAQISSRGTAEVQVTEPQENDLVTSPLTVKGIARGNWYFEASFPVKLLDAHGTVLSQAPAQAQSDWMTANFVPFTATLAFSGSTTSTGTLVLKNDNPSGDPVRDKEVRIPVRFR